MHSCFVGPCNASSSFFAIPNNGLNATPYLPWNVIRYYAILRHTMPGRNHAIYIHLCNTRCHAMPFYALPRLFMSSQARPDSKSILMHPYHASLGLALPRKSRWNLTFHASLQYSAMLSHDCPYLALPLHVRSRLRLKVAFPWMVMVMRCHNVHQAIQCHAVKGQTRNTNEIYLSMHQRHIM